mgnify:CR=1 FL=1
MATTTEQTIIRGIKNGNEWFVCKDGRREIRIGYIVNCNDEIPKNPRLLEKTCDDMTKFMKNQYIESFNIKTLDNEYEYSACLKIDEEDYQKLKNNFRNIIKCT